MFSYIMSNISKKSTKEPDIEINHFTINFKDIIEDGKYFYVKINNNSQLDILYVVYLENNIVIDLEVCIIDNNVVGGIRKEWFSVDKFDIIQILINSVNYNIQSNQCCKYELWLSNKNYHSSSYVLQKLDSLQEASYMRKNKNERINIIMFEQISSGLYNNSKNPGRYSSVSSC